MAHAGRHSKLVLVLTFSGTSIVLFFLFATFMIEVYYLSIGLQAAYNLSATDAGIRLLPLILTQIIILIASSRLIPLVGRFKLLHCSGKWITLLGQIWDSHPAHLWIPGAHGSGNRVGDAEFHAGSSV
jgi:hypothetical protein